MMKKIILAMFLSAVSGVFVSAQTAADYKKAEFFAGFSRGVIDGDSRRFFTTDNNFRDVGTQGFPGFNVSGVFNVTRYIGIKADVSGHYESGSFSFPVGNLTPTPRPTYAGTSKNSLYNALAGVQIKDNASDKRFKPFAHALVGVGIARTDINATCTPTVNCTGVDVPVGSREQGFAGAFGGGLDIRLSDRFDLRAIQFDYNPVVLNSGTLNNVRMGIGIVIH